VRWVRGTIRYLDLNGAVVLGLVFGQENTIGVILALLEIVVRRERLAVARRGAFVVLACEAKVEGLRKVGIACHPFEVDDVLAKGLVESLVARK